MENNREKYKTRSKERANFENTFLFNLPETVVIKLDKHKRVSYINDLGTKILDYSRNEIIGKKWFDYFVKKSEKLFLEENFDHYIFQNKKVIVTEIIIIGRNKEKHIIRWKGEIKYNKNDEFIGAMFVGDEVTRNRDMQMKLNHRIAFEKLMIEISKSFLNISFDKIDEKISDALANLCVFVNVDRGFIFLLDEKTSSLKFEEEWYDDNGNSAKRIIENININSFSCLKLKIQRNETIYIPDITLMSLEATDEKLILQSNGINSLLVIPMKKQDTIYGIIILIAESQDLILNEHDINLIETIAGIFVNVLFNKKLQKEKQRIEEEKRKSDELFYKSFHSSPSQMSVTRWKDFSIIDINKKFLDVIGLERKDIIGKTRLELNIWDSIKERKDVISTLLNKEKFNNIEMPFKTFTGENKIGLFSAEMIEIGNEKCILSTGVDITELKKTQNQLHLFKKLIETSDVGFILGKYNGEIIFANSTALNFLKYDNMEELIGLKMHNFYTKKNRNIILNEIFPILKKEEQWMGELKIKNKLGESVYTFQNIFLFLNEEGNKKYIGVVVYDLTQQKIDEEKFDKQKLRFQEFLEKFPLPIAISDKNNNHLYFNPKFTAILGYTLEDTPNTQEWMKKAYPNEDYREKVRIYWEKVKKKEIQPHANKITTKNGKIKNIIFLEFSLDSDRLIAICEEVTFKKEK